MNDEELKRLFREHRPEKPLGFDTRMDARLASLTGKREEQPMKRKLTWGMAIALALVLTIGITSVVSIASNGGGTEQYLIPKVADYTGGERISYTNNTVCLAGLSIKDTWPGLTDKWYNVVPVDLTAQGRQTYTLVASGMYYIGECYVDIAGDEVVVTYATYRGNLDRLSECMRFFTDLDDLTTEYLEDPTSSFAFGEKLSIRRDLKGAQVALLFVCNRVSYTIPFDNQNHTLVRYYSNKPDWKAFRADLTELLERFERQDLNETTPSDMGGRTADGGERAETQEEQLTVETDTDRKDSDALPPENETPDGQDEPA